MVELKSKHLLSMPLQQLGERLQILLLKLSKFPLESPEKLWFSDDFRGGKLINLLKFA